MSVIRNRQDYNSIILTGVLLIVAIIYLSFPEVVQTTNLWFDVIFFLLLNIGLVVSLILGVRTKRKSIMLFSLFVNVALLTIGMLFILMNLMLIAII